MGKLLLATVMMAAVTVSSTDSAKISISYDMGDTRAEALREREQRREQALEERREGGDVEEHWEWREWDNEWIEAYREKFGASAASEIEHLDLDVPDPEGEREEQRDNPMQREVEGD
ncbi:MAG: hypothetical protein ACE5EU_00130 [Paracoccaceae bacterium]